MQSPLQTIWQKTKKDFFYSDRGTIAFSQVGKSFVIAGDPCTESPKDMGPLLELFLDWAHEQNKAVCGYYFSKKVVGSTHKLRFYSAGVERGLNLNDFRMSGYARRDIRRAVNQGSRANLNFEVVGDKQRVTNKYKLDQWEDEWIKAKNRPRIGFLLSPVSYQERSINDKEHWFTVSSGDQLHAFVSGSEYKFQGRKSLYVDHLIQHPLGHRFGLDFLLSQLIIWAKEENFEYLNLGFCPFQKLQINSSLEKLMSLTPLTELFYNAQGIYRYKSKFTNNEVLQYLLVDKKYSLVTQLFAMFEVTFQQKPKELILNRLRFSF